jgi:hypothetical protein
MTRMTYTVDSHVELTVRRPGGTVETVVAEKLGIRINDAIFAQVAAATKAAGRGDVLSYRNVRREHTETDTQHAERMAGEATDRMLDNERAFDRYLRAGERDECAAHGSHREPTHKED